MGMADRILRRITKRATVALAVATLACGGSDGPTGLPPVADIVQSVAIEAPQRAVEIGLPLTLPVAPRDANGILVPGARVVWSSLDNTIATVDSTGRVQLLAPGSARIVASVGKVADTVTLQAVAPLDFVDIDAAWSHICGLTRAGAAYCWGRNAYGQLGDGTTDSRDRPVAVAGGQRFVSLSTGSDHTCAVTTAGRAYCWGRNSDGQLGNGTFEASAVPVPSAEGQFTSITGGTAHTCGLVERGQALCWGRGGNGQLGDGRAASGSTPVEVAGGYDFFAIDAGDVHTCAIAVGGAGYCWGTGELGDGGTTRSDVPVPIAGGLTLRKISAGNDHSCAVAIDDRAYCWGRNFYGEVGNGTFAPYDSDYWTIRTPSEVVGGYRFTSVVAGSATTCGVTTADRAYCWGSGRNGALGNGRTDDVNRPAAVLLGPVAAVTIWWRGCAVTPEGRAYCWGDNSTGTLGTGSTQWSLAPQRVTIP